MRDTCIWNATADVTLRGRLNRMYMSVHLLSPFCAFSEVGSWHVNSSHVWQHSKRIKADCKRVSFSAFQCSVSLKVSLRPVSDKAGWKIIVKVFYSRVVRLQLRVCFISPKVYSAFAATVGDASSHHRDFSSPSEFGRKCKKGDMAGDLLRLSGVKPEAIISDVNVDYATPLGRGSHATVYTGTWHAPVAVKVLHPLLVQQGVDGRQDLLRHFGDGCNRLRDLRHEHVVQFLGVTRSRDGTPALVTERLDTTLQSHFEKASLPLSEQLDILCDASAGLEYIHSRGVIHCDLTTRKVLLTAGPRRRAKLADVGASCSLYGNSRLSGAGSALTQCPGTLLYMPPEALTDNPSYDQKLDVFAFGVLLMCTVLGREPSISVFVSPRHFQLPDGSLELCPEIQRRREDFDAIDHLHPLRDLIERCLENDPKRRPTSKELHAELRRARSELRPSAGEEDMVRTRNLNIKHVISWYKHIYNMQ